MTSALRAANSKQHAARFPHVGLDAPQCYSDAVTRGADAGRVRPASTKRVTAAHMHEDDTTTRSRDESTFLHDAPRLPYLTILAHPDAARVGERAPLGGLLEAREHALSRHVPEFCPPDGARLRALDDAHVSRSPMRLYVGALPGTLCLDAQSTRTALEVDGRRVTGVHACSAEELERGVVLMLGGRVALLLHRLDPLAGLGLPDLGLVGHSTALASLRREILGIAALDVPVLITGESGSGKELVARALHAASPRRAQPYLAVNVGAIPAALAAAELFGATRGAFTGAERARPGYFDRAQGGTLFLDEIADAPNDVQGLLLRAVESGEIQTVGGQEPRRVDVRLLAATDANLRTAVARERFRAPLLHRLSTYALAVPALRERRDDIPRLLFHFLRAELQELDATHCLDARGPGRPTWLPAGIVARLVTAAWPGNVRQLQNVARRLAVAGRNAEVLPRAVLESVCEDASGALDRSTPEGASGSHVVERAASTPPTGRRRYRPAASLTDEELLEVLRANRFKLQPTAAQLGIARTALYERLERTPGLRSGASLTRDELLAAHARCAGDLERMVDDLQVSGDALQRRLKDLGLT